MKIFKDSARLRRFLIGGALNSGVTYVLFLLLVPLLGDLAAYSVAYAFGIALSYAINVSFVFGARPTLTSAMLFPWIYAIQYVLGLGLLWVFVHPLDIAPSIAIILVIGINAAVAFFLMRIVFQPSALNGGRS